MKMKNGVGVLLLLVISQSLMATQFSIINNSSGSIEASPRWTGRHPYFYSMSRGEVQSDNSGYHHLRIIVWQDAMRRCWVANVANVLGGLFDRARSNVIIRIYDGGKYTIDLKGTGAEGMPQQADPGNCLREGASNVTYR